MKAAKLPMFLVCLSDQVRRIQDLADPSRVAVRKPVKSETSLGASGRRSRAN
jgi:hypothetical protein